jgi:predicted nucleic acid-binding protein
MTHGIDTDFLVAVEIGNHPFHQQADALLKNLLASGHDFAVAPQILAEFIHVVTDPKRMPVPLTISAAISRAENWWDAAEVIRVFPDGPSVTQFLHWLTRYRLGRKRLLDTMLATTYQTAGIRCLISNNESDYRAFDCFQIITFH